MSQCYAENLPERVVLTDLVGETYDISGETPSAERNFETNEPVRIVPCDEAGDPYEI
jgi:hypothetical protein